MADKGFLIEKMLSEVGVKLIIPPLKKSTQLSKEDPGYCSTEDPSGKGHTQGQGIPHLGWACSTLYGRICQSALGHLLPDVKLPGTSRYQRGQTSLRLEYCK